MEKKSIRILIVDDQHVFRLGLKALIHSMEGIEIVGEASDGLMMIKKAIEIKPDLILTDIKMPELDGIAATKEVFKLLPDSRVIALSAYVKDDLILQMLEAGAMGYLVKSAEAHEIKEAIETVYNRKPYFCKETTARLTDIVAKNYKLPTKIEACFSERELEIIRLICNAFTSKEIANTLHLSKRTVEGHRTRILDKIGAKSIAGIITFAIESGIYKKES